MDGAREAFIEHGYEGAPLHFAYIFCRAGAEEALNRLTDFLAGAATLKRIQIEEPRRAAMQFRFLQACPLAEA